MEFINNVSPRKDLKNDTTSNSVINEVQTVLTITIDFSLGYTLRLLPYIWKRLVNSAGQSLQTKAIISETNTPVFM